MTSDIKERDIRRYLKTRVEQYGGEVRAVAWLGRPHAPDVLCMFPFTGGMKGSTVWVETKAPGGKPRAGQLREHERMRAAGMTILVISTYAQIDSWLPPL